MTTIGIGTDILRSLYWLAKATPTSKLLEVGSGIGRCAIPLTQFLTEEGRYVGTDIVRHGVNWCAETITSKYPNSEFVHYDVYNEFYNPEGTGRVGETPLPQIEGGFRHRLPGLRFTHLNRADVEAYLPRMADTLKPGGLLWGTWFIVDNEIGGAILDGRSKVPLLPKETDGVYYSAENKGTGAVAFDEGMIWSLLYEGGFNVSLVEAATVLAPPKTDGGISRTSSSRLSE